MKKTGLGKDPLSWIATTGPATIRKAEKTVVARKPAARAPAGKLPKFQTFEVRLTALLRDDQLDFLDRLVRDIKKNRAAEYREERITKNTIIRAFIDALAKAKLDTRNISDEEELLDRVLSLVKQ